MVRPVLDTDKKNHHCLTLLRTHTQQLITVYWYNPGYDPMTQTVAVPKGFSGAQSSIWYQATMDLSLFVSPPYLR